jgi:hypothetical protein
VIHTGPCAFPLGDRIEALPISAIWAAPWTGGGETMVSGTDTAPIAEHDPPLAFHYYLYGGSQMSQEERIAAAQEGIDGANCITCQRSQGGYVARVVRIMNRMLGIWHWMISKTSWRPWMGI